MDAHRQFLCSAQPVHCQSVVVSIRHSVSQAIIQSLSHSIIHLGTENIAASTQQLAGQLLPMIDKYFRDIHVHIWVHSSIVPANVRGKFRLFLLIIFHATHIKWQINKIIIQKSIIKNYWKDTSMLTFWFLT